MSKVDDFLSHLSEQPWSNFTEADYTLEQWHRACLIHLHDGPPTSKSKCKLPVKTPNGAVNRAGVFAATAALAGARSPLQAPADQKAKAAAALRGYYAQMGKKPPPSLAQSAVSSVLEHYGTRGMRWGVRKSDSGGAGRFGKPASRTVYTKSAKRLTNDQLSNRIRRMELEKRYSDLNKRETSKGKRFASEILGHTGKTVIGTVVTTAALLAIGTALEKRFPQLGRAVARRKG